MDFSKQDLALISDLINIAWAAGAVKNPQMGGLIEQLRSKVTAALEKPKPEVIKAEKK